MPTKKVDMYTCDDCNHLILGSGGVHFEATGSEPRLSAKWVGNLESFGKIAKEDVTPTFHPPKGFSHGPFDGVRVNTPEFSRTASLSICLKCLGKRFGFKKEETPAEIAIDPANRFNHRDPV